MNSSQRILVTGGGGFLGGRIVRLLLERGWTVRSFGRSPQPQNEQLGAEVVRGDLACAEDVARAAEGCYAVFHVAAKAGVWGSYESFFRPNVLGTRNVLAACRAHGIRFLVHTSTPSVVFNGEPFEGANESLPLRPDNLISPYAATKALAEQEVLAAAGLASDSTAEGTTRDAEARSCGTGGEDRHGLEEARPSDTGGEDRHGLVITTRPAAFRPCDTQLRVCALRPHLIYGPGDPHLLPRLLARAREKRLRRVGDGTNRVDLTHVENAAMAHILAFEALQLPDSPVNGKAYFISDGEPVNLWQWIDAYLQREGIAPVRSALSASSAWRIGALCEWLWRTFPLRGEPPMTRFVATELAKSHWFDICAARRDFGYSPRPHPY